MLWAVLIEAVGALVPPLMETPMAGCPNTASSGLPSELKEKERFWPERFVTVKFRETVELVVAWPRS